MRSGGVLCKGSGCLGGPAWLYNALMDPIDTPPEESPETPTSWKMPLVWMALAAFAVLCGGVGAGAAGVSSESAGVTASYVVTGPICFFSGGALGAVALHLLVKKAGPARTFGPVGCGCLSAMAGVAMIVFFFAAIFPAL